MLFRRSSGGERNQAIGDDAFPLVFLRLDAASAAVWVTEAWHTINDHASFLRRRFCWRNARTGCATSRRSPQTRLKTSQVRWRHGASRLEPFLLRSRRTMGLLSAVMARDRRRVVSWAVLRMLNGSCRNRGNADRVLR